MHITDLNKNNYTQFIKMINPDAKNMKMPIPQTSNFVTAAPKHIGNPYAKPGQDITMLTYWKKIVTVSDDVRTKLLSIVKDDFANNYGMSGENYDDPNGYNVTVNNYLSSLPADERSSASWTLSNIFTDEAQRLTNVIREYNPDWEFGQPFDTSILNRQPTVKGFDIKI